MAANKVGAKPSLFKKPAWASTSAKTTDNEEPIFGQTHLYQEILQEEQARRERHAAKQRERAEKEKQKEQERETKRRRLSKEDENSDDGTDDEVRSRRSDSVNSRQDQKSVSSADEANTRPSTSPPQKNKTRAVDRTDSTRSPQTLSRKARMSEQDDVILLDDEDAPSTPSAQAVDDSARIVPSSRSRSKQKSKQPDPESESEEEDEYLRELKARARAQAKINKFGMGADNVSDSPMPQISDNVGSPRSVDPNPPTKRSGSLPARATSSPAGDDEAEVKIWIQSAIPGTREVIVNRKVGQPLDKVKEYWIKRNEIEPALANKIFFTWNNNRLYNSTTMRGIIERLKKLRPMKDGSDPSNGRITIEAVTEEILTYRREQREKARAEAVEGAGVDSNNQTGDDLAAGDEAAVPEPQKATGIVIRLRAQGVEEMNLRVRPTTTVRKILTGFCSFRKIDLNKQTWLSYDGDRLEEDATVEDVGFENEDTVEVYLR